MKDCPNCEKTLNEQDQYCAACGQPVFDLHQSFFKIAHQMTHEMLDIDGRLMRTLKGLLFKPGFISEQYRQGRRISYTPPLRMYLVVSVLFFILVSFIKTPTESNIKVSVLLFPVGVLEYVPKLMFALLPIYAVILQLFQRKTHYIFNVVFAVHVYTFVYLLLMIALPLGELASQYRIIELLQYALFIHLFIYQLLAVKRFYGQSWVRSCVVAGGSFGLYLLVITFGLEGIFVLTAK
jgi:hypothetical protein